MINFEMFSYVVVGAYVLYAVIILLFVDCRDYVCVYSRIFRKTNLNSFNYIYKNNGKTIYKVEKLIYENNVVPLFKETSND